MDPDLEIKVTRGRKTAFIETPSGNFLYFGNKLRRLEITKLDWLKQLSYSISRITFTTTLGHFCGPDVTLVP